VERSTARRMPLFSDEKLQIFLSKVPTIVGPKGVFMCPDLHEFLIAIRKFVAHVVIWSSMKRSTIEEVVVYLFHRLPKPFDILG
jgi:flagellar biosynthesis protein FlhB